LTNFPEYPIFMLIIFWVQARCGVVHESESLFTECNNSWEYVNGNGNVRAELESCMIEDIWMKIFA